MTQLFIGTYIKVFFLLTPFFVISTFLSMTSGMDVRRREKIAVRTALAAAACTLGVYLVGNQIFKLFGITLDAFRVGAGTLLFLSAVSLVSGRAASFTVSDDEDISVVPLAVPITVGPGTTGALLVLGSDVSQSYGGELWAHVTTLVALLAAGLSVGVMLYVAARADRFLRPMVMSVLTKLTGLVVASIAAQLVFTGVRNFMR